MSCYLCGGSRIEQIHDRCRDSATTKVMKCTACGLVFLDDSQKISEEFYAKSGMYEFAAVDRRALIAEESFDTERRVKFLEPYVRGRSYMDFGAGTGSVANGMKGVASSVKAVELHQTHRKAIEEEFGIPVRERVEDHGARFDVITLFHVLEHLKDPVAVMKNLGDHLAPGGKAIVEVPHADDALIGRYDLKAFKDFTYWSLHLFLFTESTLRKLLETAGFTKIEVLYVQRYPLPNHLYWLAKGKPGGQHHWADLGSPELNARYDEKLRELKITDTLIAIASR